MGSLPVLPRAVRELSKDKIALKVFYFGGRKDGKRWSCSTTVAITSLSKEAKCVVTISFPDRNNFYKFSP